MQLNLSISAFANDPSSGMKICDSGSGEWPRCGLTKVAPVGRNRRECWTGVLCEGKRPGNSVRRSVYYVNFVVGGAVQASLA